MLVPPAPRILILVILLLLQSPPCGQGWSYVLPLPDPEGVEWQTGQGSVQPASPDYCPTPGPAPTPRPTPTPGPMEVRVYAPTVLRVAGHAKPPVVPGVYAPWVGG